MTDPTLRRALDVFEAALDRPPHEREAFVSAAAGSDSALLAEVLSLLAHAAQTPSQFAVPPPAPAPPVHAGAGTVLGDFTLERELGRGAMGVVHLARQRSLDRRVAVKVLALGLTTTEAQIERFHREAKAAAKLDHPHIARVLVDGTTDHLHWFAMELVPGRTLAEELTLLQRSPHEPTPETPPTLLPRSDPRHVAQLVGIVADAASALDHAHRRGVIHRDVKPSNLLLTPDGTVKLVDFGVAHDESLGTFTRSDQLLGTLPYMSPEQARVVEARVDHRTDVYSLGVVLYELLTLRRPFAGSTTHELIHRLRSQEPRPVTAVNPRIPRDLAVICQHAMSKRAAERYPTAAAFEDDLRRFLRHEAILARPPSLPSRAVRLAQRHRTALVALSLGLVALGVGAGLARRADRSRAVRSRVATLASLVQLVDWEPVDDARLLDGRRALEDLGGFALPAEGRAVRDAFAARLATLHDDWGRRAQHLGVRGLQAAEAGLDDDRAHELVVRSVQLFVRLAALFPEERYQLDPRLFQPRLSVVALDEEGRTLPGRVGVRRLDPETAVAAPTEVLGTLPLVRAPARSGHVRIVVDVEGHGLRELTRHLRSGADVRLDVLVHRGQRDRGRMVHFDGARCAHPANPSSPLRGKTLEVEPFWLDRCEVSVREYREFLTARPDVPRPPYLAFVPRDSPLESWPVVDVSWEEARAYAEWRGLRLPSHAEWMLAARGAEGGRPWPFLASDASVANAWGGKVDSRAAALRGYFATVRPVGSFPEARSPEGVYHLFGNVMEWTESHLSEQRPTGVVPEYGRRILLGSAWDGGTRGGDLTTFEHWGLDRKSAYMTRGFRCARSARF